MMNENMQQHCHRPSQHRRPNTSEQASIESFIFQQATLSDVLVNVGRSNRK